MAISNKNILPAIVIEVHEFGAKAEERDADRPEPSRTREIGEISAVVVVIKVIAVVRKVGLNNVGPAVIVIIR